MGVDPGATGALGLITPEGNRVWDMPVIRGHRKYAYPCARRLGQIIDTACPDIAAIELVATRPGQGIATSGALMYSAGVVFGALGAKGIPVTFVVPAVWKRKFGLIGTVKDAARLLAIEAFEDMATALKRKKDGGRADALMIAAWLADSHSGRRKTVH